MSGFDNGTTQQSVFAQTKQFGAVLRGLGDPAPGAGVIGDVYIDTQTWFLYAKRANNKTSPWGHYLFQVPNTYRATLNWFGSSRPGNSVGANGDYCLMWGGYPNYGMQPSILGPKAAGAWPANPVNVAVTLDPLYPAEDQNNVGATNIVPGEQNNVAIPAAVGLTVPATATYAVVTAVDGPLYATYDGTVPSAANYAISLPQGVSLPVAGYNTLTAIRVVGTKMSVSYWN